MHNIIRLKHINTISNFLLNSNNSKLISKMSYSTSKFKVFVTQPIPNEALKILNENNIDAVINQKTPLSREDLLKSVKNVDGLFCTLNEKINAELLDTAGGNLKVVATCSVGTDHIELKECFKRNIPVGYTPGVLTDAVAEYAIACLLAATRRIPEGIKAATNGEWTTWKIMWMCGKGLRNSTIGIFGLGRIGLAIAQRLKGFDVGKIIYNNRNPNREADKFNYEYVSFDQLLNQSDFLICCCAATQETNKIFNKDAFSKMKSTSLFVNVSRGVVVDQDDLYEALKNKVIGAAALDVTTPEPLPLDHKLFKLDNCLITPHISSAEEHTRINMATITAQNIANGLNNKQLVCRVENY